MLVSEFQKWSKRVKSMSRASKSLPDQDTLRKVLDYDPNTGNLTWKKRDASLFEDVGGKYTADRFCRIWNTSWAGKPAFTSLTNAGYRQGNIFGRIFLGHRIIWCWYYGTEPNEIDHIDGDRCNNRILNLRNVSSQINKKNMRLSKLNKSGEIGVHWESSICKWRAKIRANGTAIHLGVFADKNDAILARTKASIEYGYHENHGRK